MKPFAPQLLPKNVSPRKSGSAGPFPVVKTHRLSPLSAEPSGIQRLSNCACGGGCPRCIQQTAPAVSGIIQRQTTPSPTPPCPTSVSIGQVAQFNHSNLSAADQQQFRTYLGAVSRMEVGPGPNHTGHCMKEYLTTISNTCPAAVYSRGGATSEPCTGNRCLDINRWGSAGDSRTGTMLTDGPTSFIDLHRTFNRASLLEGTGVSSCQVVCEQIYKCDRTAATTGVFRITRNYQAGTLMTGTGSPVHITTGTVTKT
ncbi:hypothetical protein J5X98_00820 [Leptothermofonsia sichuanensis E412]|uniref:hypothetical protein n=1 Tax=Leptothermofonsia sichuanensis TaxID=2917832 RepID=UPI001CA65CAD|nr:hypothetical protein [Leptothermofonsia sichuanensis]QZZ21089.1 hypothetical protein J5X98_00820 [Leptothermofonsia sichuanensis E412]